MNIYTYVYNIYVCIYIYRSSETPEYIHIPYSCAILLGRFKIVRSILVYKLTFCFQLPSWTIADKGHFM